MRGPEGASVQQCTGATRHVLEPLAEGKSEVAGLLHCPVPGRVRGDAAQMHPAAAVLDEHQHVHALQQHGVHVQEINREKPGGLSLQELPPCRARPARRRIDARSTQDLPHHRRRHRDAELRQLAMDPAMSPPREMLSSTFSALCGPGDYVNARDGPPGRGVCESAVSGGQQDRGLHRAQHNFRWFRGLRAIG